jgi:hypothetical protein
MGDMKSTGTRKPTSQRQRGQAFENTADGYVKFSTRGALWGHNIGRAETFAFGDGGFRRASPSMP